MNKYEMHLDVYRNRSELHVGESKTVYMEGRQSPEAVQRTQKIVQAFENGFLPNTINRLQAKIITEGLTDEQSNIVKSLVSGVTSEVGRALVGLTCLQQHPLSYCINGAWFPSFEIK